VNAIVRAYRALNPASRAVANWAYANTGARKRARCVYCREIIATCSARYPETLTFRRDANGHGAACAAAWARRTFAATAAEALILAVQDPDPRVHAAVAEVALATLAAGGAW